MRALRGGFGRGKRKQQDHPVAYKGDKNVVDNQNQHSEKRGKPEGENAAIATRTKRRKAAAAAAAAALEVKVVEEDKVVPEEVGEKPMDSGGRSPERENVADDGLPSTPLPEKVRI